MGNKQGQSKTGHVQKQDVCRTASVQKQGNFRIPAGLMARFKVRAVRGRVSMRAVVEALVEGYVKGEFELEEEKNGPEEGE